MHSTVNFCMSICITVPLLEEINNLGYTVPPATSIS